MSARALLWCPDRDPGAPKNIMAAMALGDPRSILLRSAGAWYVECRSYEAKNRHERRDFDLGK